MASFIYINVIVAETLERHSEKFCVDNSKLTPILRHMTASDTSLFRLTLCLHLLYVNKSIDER